MFRQKIRENYEVLSPSCRKLADFILNNQLDVAFMTATQMARETDLDAATVVRFTQSLGYSGYREFIKEIQKVIKSELTASYNVDLVQPEDDADLFIRLLENEKNNLSLTQAQITQQVNDILPALVNAKTIWVTGQCCCAPLAALCATTLREVGLPAIAIASDPHETAANMKSLGKDAVVIGFSLTGLGLGVADALRFARSQGAKTIAFSASSISPAALEAEIVIVCPGRTHVNLPSFTSLAAMIAILIAAYSARYPEEVQKQVSDLKNSYSKMVEIQSKNISRLNLEDLYKEL